MDAIINFLQQTGFYLIQENPLNLVMLLVSFVLLYLAIVKKFEPLLLLPIAFGMLLTNLPGAGMYHEVLFANGHVQWSLFGGAPVTQEIIDEIEEVDAVLGTTSYDKIVEAIDEALAGYTSVEMTDIDALPLVESKRLVTTGGHFAYLKIAEGCDKHCTYCIIPKIRGNFRSVPIERLLKEAEDLVAQGVKEIILVAQETTLYGKDLYGEKSLHKLLRELCKISGLRWIRILYCYPEEITDELIQVIKEEDKICNYLDLPIQHASDGILKRMGRRTSKEQLVEIIGKLRKEIPDIAIRTTLITGFPGETQEQHEELMEFVDEMEFDRLGVFTYSPEEDTPAAEMRIRFQRSSRKIVRQN